MVVNEETYGRLTPEKIPAILAAYRENGQMAAGL
jgi:NADH:ubiquinone oxidoreductase subunit E